jgi:hypothetical protein
VRSLKLRPEIEAQLRREILQYFLFPGYTAAMPYQEPFSSNLEKGLYTHYEMSTVRKALWTAGLLEYIRGSTSDNVLVISEMGRQILKSDNALAEE